MLRLKVYLTLLCFLVSLALHVYLQYRDSAPESEEEDESDKGKQQNSGFRGCKGDCAGLTPKELHEQYVAGDLDRRLVVLELIRSRSRSREAERAEMEDSAILHIETLRLGLCDGEAKARLATLGAVQSMTPESRDSLQAMIRAMLESDVSIKVRVAALAVQSPEECRRHVQDTILPMLLANSAHTQGLELSSSIESSVQGLNLVRSLGHEEVVKHVPQLLTLLRDAHSPRLKSAIMLTRSALDPTS